MWTKHATQKPLLHYLTLNNFNPRGSINNESELVQVTASQQVGDKTLSDPMVTMFYDVTYDVTRPGDTNELIHPSQGQDGGQHHRQRAFLKVKYANILEGLSNEYCFMGLTADINQHWYLFAQPAWLIVSNTL